MKTPRCLENFDCYEAEYISRFLATEKMHLGIAKFFDQFFRDVIAEADFCIRVHLETLPLIVRDGRLKSLVETGEGTTVGGPRTRCDVIHWLYGCDTSTLEPSDYPVFGYLGPKNKRIEIVNDMSFQYGHVVLTLKRENIFNRTTMTIGDTVNMASCHRMMPTRLSSPHFTCASWMLHDENTVSISMRLPATYKLQLMAEAIIEKKYSVKEFYRLNEIFGDYNGFEFFELQIHGGVSFPGDIERVDCFNVANKEELAIVNQVKEMLKDDPIEIKAWDCII